MSKVPERSKGRGLSKYGQSTHMSLEEEYVELFQPKEQQLEFTRFTDLSEQTEVARDQLKKR